MVQCPAGKLAGIFMRGRVIGVIAGLVISVAMGQSWLPLSMFVFPAAGLVLGNLIEQICLGKAKWSFSLFTFLILAILGPLVFTWAYFEWQDWRRNSANYAPPEPQSACDILD